jgi:hypothetical protein
VPPGGHQGAAPLAPGFQALMAACQRLYPNQKNPLQVRAFLFLMSMLVNRVIFFGNNSVNMSESTTGIIWLSNYSRLFYFCNLLSRVFSKESWFLMSYQQLPYFIPTSVWTIGTAADMLNERVLPGYETQWYGSTVPYWLQYRFPKNYRTSVTTITIFTYTLVLTGNGFIEVSSGIVFSQNQSQCSSVKYN